MTENERYELMDMVFYNGHVAPLLPPSVLDFHAHTWRSADWQEVPWETDIPGGKYVVSQENYEIDALLHDGRRLFPDRPYSAVCFGYPVPIADVGRTNSYTAASARRAGYYPLLVTGRETQSEDEIERLVYEEGFLGYKVRLNWQGDDYGSVKVEDMIGPAEMRIANRLKLVVLLHVPRSDKLTDPEVQQGVRRLAIDFPEASIVLAHCGRAYLPDEMLRAAPSVRDLENVYFDTAMVMDPTVLQIAFETVGPDRVLFGTDLPVAAMRGRRVYAMDHWVDIVLEGYHSSAYRVASNNMRATFMAWEIVLAIKRAAQMAGLSDAESSRVFHTNGMHVLRRVLDGRHLERGKETSSTVAHHSRHS